MDRPMKAFPTTGNRKIPVLVVAYSDRAMNAVSTKAFYENLLNGATSSDMSMRKYYQDMSNGALNLTIDVHGPYTAPKTLAYYGGNTGGPGSDAYPGELVGYAIDQAEAAGVNFAPYDNDGDGKVDIVMVIHAGPGEERSGSGNDIWSHAWDLYSAGSGNRYYDGKTISKYTIQPEYNSTAGDSTIGVFCHEFGHVLGLPDMYDTSYQTYGAGRFTLMAGGSWLGATSGSRPAPLLAWEKRKLGWLTTKLPDGTTVADAGGVQDVMLASRTSAGQSRPLPLVPLLALGLAGLGGFFSWRRRDLRGIIIPLIVALFVPGSMVFLASCSDDDSGVIVLPWNSSQSVISSSPASQAGSVSSTTNSGSLASSQASLSGSAGSVSSQASMSGSAVSTSASGSVISVSSSAVASSSAPVSSASQAMVSLPYEQNFNASSSIPFGWRMISGTWGVYTGTYAVGGSENSIKLDGTKTIEMPFFNQSALSLDVEGYYNVSSGGNSPLTIRAWTGSSWNDVVTITDFPSRSGWDASLRPQSQKSISLPANTTGIRFVFTKTTGNLSLDNVYVRLTGVSSSSSSISSVVSSSAVSSSSQAVSSSSSSSLSSAASSVFSAHALTVDGGWTAGTITVPDGEVWFSFEATAGASYSIYWDDAWQGSGSYTLYAAVSCYRADRTTSYFIELDSAYTTPKYITAAVSGTIYLKAVPYDGTGTLAMRVTSSGPPSISLDDIESSHTAIKIPLGDSQGKQYYLVENKRRITGTWTEYLPGDGLLICHIHDGVTAAYLASNAVNDTSSRIHGVNVVEADNNASLWVKSSQGQSGDLFKSRSFTPATSPATVRYTATASPWALTTTASGVYLENISAAGPTMTFTHRVE